MTDQSAPPESPASTTTASSLQKISRLKIAAIIAAVFAALFYWLCGFYSIQPIGALPDGATAIVWRDTGEPFFNSADALCLERTGGVSLMCRAMAMGQAPTDRIIMRLPYLDFAYSMSTGGRVFDS